MVIDKPKPLYILNAKWFKNEAKDISLIFALVTKEQIKKWQLVIPLTVQPLLKEFKLVLSKDILDELPPLRIFSILLI